MIDEESYDIMLRDDYYQDSFGKIIAIIVGLSLVIVGLMSVSFYLYWQKPTPITFQTAEEWRVQAPVPINAPYLTTPSLLQWVSEVLPQAFSYDFQDYNAQLQENQKYFTSKGWQIFLNQLNNYINYSDVQSNKLFVNATPASAPSVINQGLLSGRYAWWVEMQIKLDTVGPNNLFTKLLTLQALVVRVPTLNNLMGIGIDNVIVVTPPKSQDAING